MVGESIISTRVVGGAQMSSILFGDTMLPMIEEDYILLLGIVFM